jgi:hypothetical protein
VRHGLAVAGTAVLPGAVVAVVGGWGAALVHRRLPVSTRLPVGRVPLLRRVGPIRDAALAGWIADALAAGVACADRRPAVSGPPRSGGSRLRG